MAQGMVKNGKGPDMPQSRAPKQKGSIQRKQVFLRQRREGAGTTRKAGIVRQALYEWWTGLRYAIDWKKHAANRAKRNKKVLARFPRAVLRAKVIHLLQDYAYAALLNGERVDTFIPSARWFCEWEPNTACQ